MLEARFISYHDGEIAILDRVNLQVEYGQSAVITGPSGAGKTLLFSILSGLTKPDKGDVLIEGKSLFRSQMDRAEEIRKKLGVVFQVPALLSNLSLYENLELCLKSYWIDAGQEEIKSRIVNELRPFGLQDHLEKRPDKLSRGQQYLAAIVRAFLINPYVFLWDDPFSTIDDHFHQYIHDRIKELKHENKIVLFFTNKQHLIKEYGDVLLGLDQSDGV